MQHIGHARIMNMDYRASNNSLSSLNISTAYSWKTPKVMKQVGNASLTDKLDNFSNFNYSNAATKNRVNILKHEIPIKLTKVTAKKSARI
jgi:hypothetical protein